MNSTHVKDVLFKTPGGEYVYSQKPNWPIILWLVTLIASRFTEGTANELLSAVSTAALVYWALLEIISGSNLFRRILGLIVLLWIAV